MKQEFIISRQRILDLSEKVNIAIIEPQLKEWYPEAFKEELDLNTWYDYEGDHLMCFTCLNDTYNAKGYGFIFGKWKCVDAYNAIDGMRIPKPATKEQVEEALIKEAKERGFNKGVKVDRSNILLNENVREIIEDEYFRYFENYLEVSGITIFNTKGWATVIEQPKEEGLKQELEDLRNALKSFSESLIKEMGDNEKKASLFFPRTLVKQNDTK